MKPLLGSEQLESTAAANNADEICSFVTCRVVWELQQETCVTSTARAPVHEDPGKSPASLRYRIATSVLETPTLGKAARPVAMAGINAVFRSWREDRVEVRFEKNEGRRIDLRVRKLWNPSAFSSSKGVIRPNDVRRRRIPSAAENKSRQDRDGKPRRWLVATALMDSGRHIGDLMISKPFLFLRTRRAPLRV